MLFVSVDSERDTPEALKAYMASFDPRITALTGSPSEIAAAAAAFDAYYEKVPGTDGSFTFDHTRQDLRARIASVAWPAASTCNSEASVRRKLLAPLLAKHAKLGAPLRSARLDDCGRGRSSWSSVRRTTTCSVSSCERPSPSTMTLRSFTERSFQPLNGLALADPLAVGLIGGADQRAGGRVAGLDDPDQAHVEGRAGLRRAPRALALGRSTGLRVELNSGRCTVSRNSPTGLLSSGVARPAPVGSPAAAQRGAGQIGEVSTLVTSR